VTKKWWLSKTVWNAFALALLGIYNAIGPIQHWPPVPMWLLALLGASGITLARVSNTTLTK
jgi:hypothetical protein